MLVCKAWVIQRVCRRDFEAGRAADGGGAITAAGTQPVPGLPSGGRPPPVGQPLGAGTGQSGVRGLRKAKRTGRPPKLSAAQLRQIEQGLKRGPEALGSSTGLWTSGRVRALIEDRTGVRYHADHVWRILRKLGWTCQRPTGQALERDEQGIRHWKRVEWPRIKKKRSASGALSSSSTRAG